jgi:tetratricopeptide (TPR) repeat protein
LDSCEHDYDAIVSRREEWHHRLSNLEFRRSGVQLGLTGPAGIGKSFAARNALTTSGVRFVNFAANADAFQLARGWTDALTGQMRHLPQWVQSHLQRWARGEMPEMADLGQALAVAVRSLAPFAVLLEDWHEAGEAQRSHWESTLLALRGLPNIGVIVTSRNALPTHLEVIPLRPLTREEASALLEAELHEGSALPMAMLDWVWERGRGNPLFLLEYVRDLRRRGHAWFDGQAWQWREPPADRRPITVEALIERSLDRVTDPRAMRVLEARALLGERDDPALWQAVTDLDQKAWNTALRELETQGVMRGPEFTHPLYREIALERSSPAVRQDIAARSCRHLEERDPVQAAEFAGLAGFDAVLTLEFHLRAVAALESDPSRAALQKARACEYAEGETRLRLALEAGRVLVQTNLKPVVRLMDSILRDHPDHLEALGLRARVLARLGDERGALSSLERIAPARRERRWYRWHALALVEAGQAQRLHRLVLEHESLNLEDDAEIATGVAQALVMQGRVETARALLERALGRNTDPEAKARLLIAQGAMLIITKHPRDGEVQLQRIVHEHSSHIPKRLLASTWFNLGVAAHQLNHLEDAAQRYHKSARIALEIGDQQRYLSAQSALGGLYFDLGDFEAAERALLEGRSLNQTFPPSRDVVQHDGWLSELYTCWLPPHGAALSLKYAHSALRMARQLEDAHALFHALYRTVCAEANHGNPDVAMRCAEEMATLPHDEEDDAFLVPAARGAALMALGRKAEAIGAYERAEELIADNPSREVSLNQVRLELDVLRGDAAGARKRLEFFQTHNFGPGIAVVTQYFPQLQHESAPSTSSHTLRLEVLGPMRLVLNGEAVALRGAKRKTLLALLLEAHLSGHHEARSADLCDALYPNATDDEGKAAIKQLVFQLRAQLGTDSVQTTTSGYALRGAQSDAQTFLETGDTSLWRGAYLADISSGGTHALEPIREVLYGQLRRRAEALVATNPAEASRLARILLEVDPYDADALTLALRALQAQGNFSSLSKIYQRSRETWLEVGEHLPERWTEFLADAAD